MAPDEIPLSGGNSEEETTGDHKKNKYPREKSSSKPSTIKAPHNNFPKNRVEEENSEELSEKPNVIRSIPEPSKKNIKLSKLVIEENMSDYAMALFFGPNPNLEQMEKSRSKSNNAIEDYVNDIENNVDAVNSSLNINLQATRKRSEKLIHEVDITFKVFHPESNKFVEFQSIESFSNIELLGENTDSQTTQKLISRLKAVDSNIYIDLTGELNGE
jgi:hypothetical protein